METQQTGGRPLTGGSERASTPIERRAWSAGTRRRLRLSARWLVMTLVALLLTLLFLVVVIQPSPDHLAQLALTMGLTGLGSLVAGEMALWALQFAPVGGVRLKLVIPPLLTAAVIAFNVTILARQMFITVTDGQLLLAFLLFGASLALAMAYSIAHEMSWSIARIEEGARRIAGGDYAFQLDATETRGADEIARLASWFNQMAASVRQAFLERQRADAERRQVITAVSHDLRTPVASVRAMIEAIDDGVVSDPETVRRYQRAIRAEMGRLSLLMDDLFDLSQLEARTLVLRREWVDLGDLISDTLEACRELAEQSGATLRGQVDGDLGAVWLDPRQMYRVLMNLTLNAIRYTPRRGAIVLRAELQSDGHGGSHALVQVIDSGVGIASDDLPHVFERSFRGEHSRRREQDARDGDTGGSLSSGSGLGLAIAREIVEMHNGRIWAVSPLPPPLTALVRCAQRDGVQSDGVQPDPHAPCVGAVLYLTLPITPQPRHD
jgi:two-component system, OmpR family, sensor histidine kinase SaeS